MTNIFISYRRESGRDIARSIYLALGKAGFDNVFFDYNSLRDGLFNEKIITAIEECTDFILILSKGSMLRCNAEGDWVAREIHTAISSKCHIIPINIDNLFDGFPFNFPKQLEEIKHTQFITLHTDDSFDSDIDRLISRLYTKCGKKQNATNGYRDIIITSDETCKIYINDNLQGKLKSGKEHTYSLNSNEKNIIIKAVSLARANAVIEQELHLSENKAASLNLSFLKKTKEDESKIQIEKEQKANAEKRRKILKSVLDTYDSNKYHLMSCDMVMVEKDGAIGFVNDDGFEIIPCQYNDAIQFNENFAFVKESDSWICIDKYGNSFNQSHSEFPSVVIGGRAIIGNNGKKHLFSPTNVPCSSGIYDNLVFTSNPQLLIANTNKKYYIINASDGRPTFNDYFDDFIECNKHYYGYYDICVGFCYFPLIINKNGKYGAINSNGKFSVPFISHSVVEIGLINRFFISINGKYALVDIETGKYITPPIYDYVRSFPASESDLTLVGIGCFVDDAYRASGGMQGMIDSNGNEIVPLIYHSIDISTNGQIHCWRGIDCEYSEFDPKFRQKYLGKEIKVEHTVYDPIGVQISQKIDSLSL